MRARWFARTTVTLTTLAIALSGTAARSQSPRVVQVSAERFAFTPSRIVVDAGEEIELHLTSDDTAHGFRIARTNINLTIPKRGRKEAIATIRLTEPGRYEFECSRMCGAGHHFMRGELIVRAPGSAK